MIEIKNLYISYGDKEVLHDVSFGVKENHIHALVGENNAGKTTLMKALAGIYRVDKGEIRYDGEPVFDNPAVKQQIGYMADHNAFLRGYTVKRMIKLYQNMYPAFSTELFEKMNHKLCVNTGSIVQTFSKGTAAKLAFMLALSAGGKYLLLDEPISGVDAESRKYMMDYLISETEKRELAVLISSHNLGELERICDTVTLLGEGKVLKTDDADQILNTFVKVTAIFENGDAIDISEIEGIVETSNVGSIYTIISTKDFDVTKRQLVKIGAVQIDKLPMGLEETSVLYGKCARKHWR